MTTRRLVRLLVLWLLLPAGCAQPDAELDVEDVTQAVTINGGDLGGADLVPNNGDVLAGTFTNVGTFRIGAGVTVFVSPGIPLDVSATATVIDGVLDANAAGSPGGPATPQGANSVALNGSDGFGPGRGFHGRAGPCVHGGGGGGAGYGGAGGTGGYHFNESGYPNGGSVYGSDADLLVQLGSGGGGGGTSCSDAGGAGGAGGGSIRIQSNTIAVNGLVTANGAPGSTGGRDGGAGGGGSGGGIALLSSNLSGTGSVTARGGKGGSEIESGLEGDGGGGGGGRIKLLVANASFSRSVIGGAVGGPCTGGAFFCQQPGLDGSGGSVPVKLTPSPTSVAFATTQVGQVSAPQVITVTNSGGTDLAVSAPTTIGPFVVDAAAFPVVVAPGGSAQFSVTFAPSSPGPANGEIRIPSNDPASPTVIPVSGTGVAPKLTPLPPALNFGPQRVGTPSPPQLVRARNDGVGPVTITAIGITGPFVRTTPALPVTLAPGAAIDVTVTFAPVVSGPANGQLTFTSDAPPVVVGLTGDGIQPLIAVNPANVNFGDQRVGTTTVRSVVVSNPGSDQLVISALAISGGPVFATTNPVPIVIPPGASATLAVQFTPPSGASFNGTLTISSNASPGITSVPLSGRGVEPLVAVNPASLAFGNRRVGTTSGTKNVVVTNTGTSALTVAFIGIDPPFTATAPATPFVLAPGATATIQVAFAPTAAGSVTRDLVIMTDAVANTKLVPCTGTGTEPVINASTASLAFGNVRTGTTSAGQTVTISNVGTAPLTLTAATAPAPFTIASPTLPRSVLPGASVTFTVKFAPTADGPASGSVVITSDAAGSPTQVAVTGTGVSPEIAVSPALQDFGDVRVGSTSAPASVSIQNPGTEPLTVTGITLAAPFARTTVALPATITPGGSLAFDVTFSPTARVLSLGTITISSEAGPASINLRGRGVAPLIAASLDPVDFGTVAIDSTASLLLQLSNSGDAPLAISALAFAGSNAGDFAFTSAPGLPAIVAPGGSLTLSIDFTPGDHGARTAQLVATSDALGNATLAVGLAGAGSGPRVALTPPALDFGATNVTTTTAPRTVAISNTGESELVVSSIVLGGVNATDFAVTATLPLTLAPGASSEIAFTFTPSAVGARAASATIVTTDPLVPTAVVTLAGAGESPELAVSPASLAFGDLRVGQAKALPFTITNTGTGPLTITTLAVSGADAGEFALEAIAVPLVLAPSASRSVTVTFRPTVLGSAAATLELLSDDPVTGTVAAPLTGTGVSPSVALSPGDVDFGGQLVGRLSAPRQLRIQNTGSGPLAVTSLAIAGAQASSFTLVSPPALPATVAPNAELVLSLRVTPAMIGAHAADLVIGTDSPDAPSASAGLAALGISTALTLTPATIDFGTARVAMPGAPVAVTLTNLTGDTLTLVDAVLGGARPADFTVTSIAGILASGASVTAMVSYSATAAGTSAATLTFRTTDPAIPQAIVTLAGKAVSTFVTADRGELAFGQIQLGDRSGPKSITLTNVTTSTVTIASVVAGDDQFVVDASAATVAIPPGGNVTFTVTFEPTADALSSSQIAVTLAGGTEPELAIAVSGEGTSPSGGGCSTTPGSSGALLLALALLLRRRRPNLGATARRS